MRILQVVESPQRRGAEVFAFQLSGELRRQGSEVETCYLGDWQGAGRLPLVEGDVVLNARSNPGRVRQLRRLLRDRTPDVVQANGATTVQVCALATRLCRARSWVLVRRGIGDPLAWLRDPLRRSYYRWVVSPSFDGVVAVSDSVGAAHRASGFRGPIVTIPNGVDPEAISPTSSRSEVRAAAGASPTTPVLAWIGALSPEKRPDRLLRVVRAVRSTLPALVTWVVGDGPLRAQTEAAATGLGVHFWGVQERVGDLLAASDVLALTSDTEGLPAVVLEAACLGVPTVATRVGGLPECVVEGETGLLVRAEDEPAFAAAVCGLLTGHEVRRAMGAKARERFERSYHMRQVAAQYLDFYRALSVQRVAARARA